MWIEYFHVGILVNSDKFDIHIGNDKEKNVSKRSINRSGSRNMGKKRELNYLENKVSACKVLIEPIFCKHCGIKKLQYEPKGFCYYDGVISLVHSRMPSELYDLFMFHSNKGKHFRMYVRTYNNTFAFTSFGVKYEN